MTQYFESYLTVGAFAALGAVLVMVMLGGQGTVLGPILGAFAYQGMRGFLVTSEFFKDIQLSVSGALLLIIVLFIPAGAIGWLRHRIPTLRRVFA